MSRPKKFIRPQFSKYRFQIESAWAHSLWAHADSIWKRYFENCGRMNFFGRLIILLTDPILSHSPNFGWPKQGQKKCLPIFLIHFLNPECVRIPWVLAPKKFPLNFFGYGAFYQKNHFLTNFCVPSGKKCCGTASCVLNFDTADLKRPSKVRYPRFVSTKISDFEVFFCTKTNFLVQSSIFA